MILPTPRCAVTVACSVPIAAVVLSAMPDSFLAALYLPGLALVLFLYDVAKSPPASALETEFTPPKLLYAGTPETFRIPVSLPGHAGELRVRMLLEVLGPVKDHPSVQAAVLDGEGEAELELVPRRRGGASFRALWTSWRGPLGFAETRVSRPLAYDCEIVQDVRRVHGEALAFLSREGASGALTLPVRGEGSEFENLSEYRRGMDNRFIDWKRSARHRRLLAKEFRMERNCRVVLGFDTGRLMCEPVGGLPRLDHFVRAGLLLGWLSLRSGDLVGSCGFDSNFRSFLSPGRTPSFFLKLQRFTSRLDYRAEETNFTLCLTELASRLRHRSLVVLFTEFGESAGASLLLDCLELLSRRHLVVFVSTPDPQTARLAAKAPADYRSMAESVIAEGLMRDRAVALERVSRLGVWSLDLPPAEAGAALLNRYLTIKQRGLL
ncbi:MAG: DUF58 domain-containing protein [Deltaproteobacteria bacterium]|jgi:uncharacterized protein (DUF58 family)|nr:DUF58 domain-containing protein [Deltaproteobacteria bacterium]